MFKPVYKQNSFFIVKDGFRQGEYSVYSGDPSKSHAYILGVSKLYEAKRIVSMLNTETLTFKYSIR